MASKKPLRNSLQLTACAAIMTAVLYPAAEASAVENIQRYCTASWRNAGVLEQDWEDCTQEAIENLLERVSRNGLVTAIQQPQSEQRRELNRSIWRTAQRWRRAKRHTSLDALEFFEAAEPTVEPTGDDLDRVETAMAKLSETQQQILSQWSNGDSVAEIAEKLDLSAARVSDQKYKAIRKLQRMLHANAA